MCLQKLKYFVSLIIIVTLSGCGLKGSLYKHPLSLKTNNQIRSSTRRKNRKNSRGFFNRKGASLYAEDCAVTDIARQFGTPAYIYSRATIERHWHAFDQAAGNREHLVCCAVKANSNIAVLNVMARLGSRL